MTTRTSAQAASKVRSAREARTLRGGALGLDELAGRLRRRGEEAGLAAVGIAPATPMEATRRILEERKAAGLSADMQFTYRNPARSTDPGRALTDAAALVVGAWPYAEASQGGANGSESAASAGAPAPSDRPQGRVARYARRDYYQDLRTALGELAALLTDAGWRARVVADDNALVDRAVAERSGLGWFGKNSNILLPGRGSWFLLGSVITDAPLRPSDPVPDGCGSCRRCLPSCPTGALVAPGVLDARKCLAWLLQATGVFPFEYRVALEGRVYGCDDCQDACPANRLAARMATDGHPGRSAERSEQPMVPVPGAPVHGGPIPEGPVPGGPIPERPIHDGPIQVWLPAEGAEVDLLELLSASDESLLARYGRWYIPQRDPRYLRRNALVALGNVADGRQSQVAERLAHYLDHPDELLRAHAVWASFRTRRHDLVSSRPALLEDPSPIVREELARRADVPTRSTASTARPG
jgi:epoxyqueuosine reductase